MLPKPEKIKKNTNSESESTGDKLSSQEKTLQKRHLLIIIISLTVGLSLIFWLYHFFKTTSFSVPKFSTPKISVTTDPLEKQLQSILKSDYPHWSFTVQFDSPSPYFWSSSATSSPIDLPSVSATIKKLKQPVDPFISNSLPQGLKIMELTIPPRYQFIIITPQGQIYVDIVTPLNNSQLPDQIKTILPVMYWSAVKH